MRHRWAIATAIIAIASGLMPDTPASAQLADADPTPAPITQSPEPSPAPTTAAPPSDAVAHDRAGYTYSYVIQDRRLKDTIESIETYKPFGNAKSRFRPFVAASIVRDSRTTSGTSSDGGPPVPLIYSDNYAVIGAGIQYTTPQGFRAYIQGGVSTKIGPVAALPSGGDLRGGLQLYREWGKTYDRGNTYGNFYGSATYLSRYSDTVFYNQLEFVHNIGSSQHPLEPFVRVTLSADSRLFYYSNAAELTLGLRYHPFGRIGPIFALEGAGAQYLRGALPATESRSHTTLRPSITYGFNL